MYGLAFAVKKGGCQQGNETQKKRRAEKVQVGE
jgi:hypothetical protein